MTCLTADQLGEAALLAVCRFFLVDKGEAVVLECLEEVLPRNLFERVVVATPRVATCLRSRVTMDRDDLHAPSLAELQSAKVVVGRDQPKPCAVGLNGGVMDGIE